MNYVQTLLSLMLLWVKGGGRGESSGAPRPEVVGGRGGGGVKPLVYRRQWKLRHMTLFKWVKTTASIRKTHCRSFDQM